MSLITAGVFRRGGGRQSRAFYGQPAINLLTAANALPIGGSGIGTWRAETSAAVAAKAGGGLTATVNSTGFSVIGHGLATDAVAVTPGQTISGFATLDGPTGRLVRASLRWVDPDHTTYSVTNAENDGTNTAMTSGVGTVISVTATVPATAGYVVLRFKTAGTWTSGQTYAVTQAAVRVGNTTTWVAGS